MHILIFYLIISNQRHSIIYWWISKSNSSKESCCEVEYEVYDKIHMWRISIVFLHILIFYLIISNQRHSIIYWWISKSNSSKISLFSFCIFLFFILWIFKTWYLFAIYQFNHMYHILLSISYRLSYYFWKSINKWRNGGDLKLGLLIVKKWQNPRINNRKRRYIKSIKRGGCAQRNPHA